MSKKKNEIMKVEDLPDLFVKAMTDAQVEIEMGGTYLWHKFSGWDMIKVLGVEWDVHNKIWRVKFVYGKGEYENPTWKDYGGNDLYIDSFEDATRMIKYDPHRLGEFLEIAEKGLETGEVEQWRDDSPEINTTALVGNNSDRALNSMAMALREKQNKVALVKASMEIIIAERKHKLETIKRKMEGFLAVFTLKIKKVMRVINVLELYLGIEEELFHLQEGPAASEKEPITMRQLILFMDEEVGATGYESIDAARVKEFDHWLLKNENFKKLVPEEKCVVAIKPRRYRKVYTSDPRENERMNHWNFQTYFLIRNGENLYRVFTEKIHVADRLFPLKNEVQGIMDEVNRMGEVKSEQDGNRMDEHEQKIHQFQQRAFFLQGLIDRTSVFNPKSEGLSVFNMSDDSIRFIYDDEASLPTGRLPFRDYQQKINAEIKKGSRIIFVSPNEVHAGYQTMKDYKDRLYYYCNDLNCPPFPGSGLYDVVFKKYTETDSGWRSDKPEDSLAIVYKPKDTVYGGWSEYDPHERKKGVSFRIDPEHDRFVLNYEEMTLDDINFYLESRVDRPNYLNMLPVLRWAKETRLKEMAGEAEFIKMIYGSILSDGKEIAEETFNSAAWKTVEWWKTKNMIKRCLTKDDALAFRMIKKQLLKEL